MIVSSPVFKRCADTLYVILGHFGRLWSRLVTAKNPDELIDLFTRRDLRGGRGTCGRGKAERATRLDEAETKRKAEGGAYRTTTRR